MLNLVLTKSRMSPMGLFWSICYVGGWVWGEIRGWVSPPVDQSVRTMEGGVQVRSVGGSNGSTRPSIHVLADNSTLKQSSPRTAC